MASLTFEHIAVSWVDLLARPSTTQMTRRRGTNYASMHCGNCYGMNNLNDSDEDLALSMSELGIIHLRRLDY